MLTSATESNTVFAQTGVESRPGTYVLLLSSATDAAGRLTVGLEVVMPRHPSRTDGNRYYNLDTSSIVHAGSRVVAAGWSYNAFLANGSLRNAASSVCKMAAILRVPKSIPVVSPIEENECRNRAIRK